MAESKFRGEIDHGARTSMSDQVFDVLYKQVLSLELPPGTKLSEVEVAKQLEISRQPVRDAFFRLSKLGFLLIQPQKATRVTQIRVEDIHRARFIRTAIEMEIVRRAVEALNDDDLADLAGNLDKQQEAVDRGDSRRFHLLDDGFHHMICKRAGLGFAWEQVKENKAHTDRVRFLSLASGSQGALDDHRVILDRLVRRDVQGAVDAMRAHLTKIEAIIDRLRDENHSWFSDD